MQNIACSQRKGDRRAASAQEQQRRKTAGKGGTSADIRARARARATQSAPVPNRKTKSKQRLSNLTGLGGDRDGRLAVLPVVLLLAHHFRAEMQCE